MLEIDASQGEGGGQILRTALSLAMLTGTPITLNRIRAKRPKPGLMRQHLACVQAAQAISGATVSGAELGSAALTFEPGALRGGDYRFEIGTAGSCVLVLQTVWPALLRAPATSVVTLTGGTHNPLAPPFHFIERAFAPLVRRLGTGVDLQLRRHGFYPAGGGEVRVEITPADAAPLQPFDLLTRGALQRAHAECLAPGLARSVAARELETLGAALGWSDDQLLTPTLRQNEGPGNALMATLAFEHVTELFTSFGDKSLSAEQVARQLALQVQAFLASSAALGPFLADQWALPLALAVHESGRAASYTASDLSLHARTNFEVIEKFLPVAFSSAEIDGGGWRVDVSP